MEVELAVMAVIEEAFVPEVTAVTFDPSVESMLRFGS
jgi:hypothetical protein|tara:strand:- start:400 stop:510 length:111 start_codon:yes stop_codon:yes gene_type:complete